MFINSEKDLEDYICNNIENFINFLYRTFNINEEEEKIEFVGRQVEIAGNRMDLLFRYKWENKENTFKRYTFIVVELKYRNAEPKDLAQLSKYMNLIRDIDYILNEKYESDEIEVKGLLLTNGLNDDMQEIQMNLDYNENTDIYFASYNSALFYKQESFSRIEQYVEKMTYDTRFLTKEEERCGEKKND